MVTKRSPHGGFLCHCPLGAMRCYSPASGSRGGSEQEMLLVTVIKSLLAAAAALGQGEDEVEEPDERHRMG